MTNIMYKLISLPREFSQKNTVSMYDLLQAVGYASIARQVSEQDLYDALFSHPDFVNEWLEYSEDKRCAGWYFRLNDSNKYLVGYFDLNRNIEIEYDNRLEACAAFVKHELDEIIKK